MGSCCSKPGRQGNSHTHAVEVLHPSLERWKVRRRSVFTEFEAAGHGAAVTEHIMPVVMRVKPPVKPSFGFPSIHYNVNANLLCDSAHSSSRSLGGTYMKHLSISSSNRFNTDKATTVANQHIGSQQFGLSLSSRRHCLPDEEPETEVPPAFSFATQPYVEPDFFNTVFAFHPPMQNCGLAGMSINSSDNVQLKVRHKHMFPQDIFAVQGCNGCSLELPSMKRSRSHGKLPAEDGSHILQPHRRSLQETLTGGWPNDLCNDLSSVAIESILKPLPMPAFSSNSYGNDIVNDEDEDSFHDINLRDSISGIPTRYAHANEQITEEIKYCISMEASSHSKADPTMDPKQHDASSTALLVPQKKTPCLPGREDEWHECHGREGVMDNVTTLQPLAVVSTGDAVLFSGSNLDEFHLIPSKFVPPSNSPPPSPRMNLSPLKQMSTYNSGDGDDKVSNLSVEDIIALLESDDVNEDELLSVLINTKSPSMSPTALSPTSLSSLSPVSLKSVLLPSSSDSFSPSPMSSSPLSSQSSISSPSPPTLQSWHPCPPSTASTSLAKSLLSSMPAVMLPFSTPTASASRKASPQCSSKSHKTSPTASFEFKVKSCNSAASTPMFSPIRSTVKRSITQLKPTVLTSEEIAEIWGVFERRQALVTRH